MNGPLSVIRNRELHSFNEAANWIVTWHKVKIGFLTERQIRIQYKIIFYPSNFLQVQFAIFQHLFSLVTLLEPIQFLLQKIYRYRDSPVNTVSITRVLDLTRFFLWRSARFPQFNTEIFGTPNFFWLESLG